MLQRGRKSAALMQVVVPDHDDDDEPTFRPVRQPDAPSYLSPAMKAWWREVTARYRLEECQLKLLEAAASAWDRLEAARKDIQQNGLTYTDSRGHRRPNPAVAIERDARIGYARLCRELGLTEAVKG